MEKLIIEASDFTPKIHLDPDKLIFIIAGESRPMNSEKFYEPVINWFKNYQQHLVDNKVVGTIDIAMHLDYYNTGTARIFFKLFEILEDFISPNIAVHVKWFYEEHDEDLKDQGEELANTAPKLTLELICLEQQAA